MGMKADLAAELRAMVRGDKGLLAMGLWLAQNADVVSESLEAMDDIILIPEIDLNDPASIERLLASRA